MGPDAVPTRARHGEREPWEPVETPRERTRDTYRKGFDPRKRTVRELCERQVVLTRSPLRHGTPNWACLERGAVARADTLCDLSPHLNALHRITESLERLVQLCDAWGKPAQAAEWKQKLAAFQQANKASDNKSKTP